MTTVHDVAAYVLKQKGPMTAMKLQKLVYYSQAWSLVWNDKPLFPESIEAWANGPVVPALYAQHKGLFEVASLPLGDIANLTAVEIDTIDRVLSFYGDKPSQWLSELTHAETPWKSARKNLPDGERGDEVIPHADMAEYYGSL